MDPKHAPDFEAHLVEVCDLYERNPPSRAALRIWWQALDAFPWELVREAINAHCAACKFAPRPADIVERLTTADGRPSADEAWSIAVQAQDEAASVVWTAEIVEAWTIARAVLDEGDAIGGRRTFIATYERLVAEARRSLRPAAWSASLGTDPERRIAALAAAVRQGRLPAERARALVGPASPQTAAARENALVAGLLTGKVATLPTLREASAKRFLEAVRAGIEGAGDVAERERAARLLEREAERGRAADHKRTELQRLSSHADQRANVGPGAA